jgi:hypothetical protein
MQIRYACGEAGGFNDALLILGSFALVLYIPHQPSEVRVGIMKPAVALLLQF